MTTSMFQLLPELTADEFAELREDIRRNGIRVPVDVDEDGEILDGHHRARVAAELGCGYPTRVLSGLTKDQKRAHALAVNVHRRQLNQAQKRELIRASLVADPQLSDRQHAARTGATHPTVAAVREELESVGVVESFTTRVGRDGVEQPVGRTPQASEEEPEPTAVADLEPEPELELEPVVMPAGQSNAEPVLAGIDQYTAERANAQDAVPAAMPAHLAVREPVPAQTQALLDDVYRRIGPAHSIATGCELLLDKVRGIDPASAVREAPDEMLSKLAVVGAALDYLTRVVAALQPAEVNV